MGPVETGKFIRQKRKELNLSQMALSQMLYVEPQTISKWERGLGMPDYDNLSRLKDIFNCSITDLLEPEIKQDNEHTEKEEKQKNEIIIVECSNSEEQIKFSDYFSPRRIKKFIERVFGVEYVETYNTKFLFKGLLKKRTKEDFETSITQGMFNNKISHPILGMQAPWLYIYALVFMLVCTGITLVGALIGFAAPFIVVAAFMSTLPLLIFLFESNFSRDTSIVSVFAIFMIGGICSLLLSGVASYVYPANEILSTVVFAPIVEETMKAILVAILIARNKPKNILTGILIGFAVGAGFSFFENLHYALNAVDYGEELEYIWTILIRSGLDFIIGHHYWTAIFAAFYTFFNFEKKTILKTLFDWRVLVALLYSIGLHMLWNGTNFLLVTGMLSVLSLIMLINVGIAQIKLQNIREIYNSENNFYFS